MTCGSQYFVRKQNKTEQKQTNKCVQEIKERIVWIDHALHTF